MKLSLKRKANIQAKSKKALLQKQLFSEQVKESATNALSLDFCLRKILQTGNPSCCGKPQEEL